MIVSKYTRDILLKIRDEKRVYLEGNILKLIESEEGDDEFNEYLTEAINRDKTGRRQRLEVTKQVQKQNNELLSWKEENEKLTKNLIDALNQSEKSKEDAEKARKIAEDAKDNALNDLDVLQKKSQTELINIIVRVSLIVIISVGIITTLMYGFSMWIGRDTQIIGSTWSNMFGILLTNAFSIIGTIMGVKYASENKTEC